MEKIFLSYRREDSREITARINDWFDMYFGRGVTFRDIDSLQAGRRFPEDIRTALDSCSVGIIVIDEKWATIGSDEPAGPRILREGDYVRMEIRRMLERGIPILTVLLNDADMPRGHQLPEDIRGFETIGAAKVRTGRDFPAHVHFLAEHAAKAGGVRLENYPESIRGFRSIGLTAASMGLMSTDAAVLKEIGSAQELLILMNDGRGFLDNRKELVLTRTTDPTKRTRVVFLHPNSEFLKLPEFLKKVVKDHHGQVHDIERGYRALRDRASSKSHIEIRGSHAIFPCTYVISENYAFQSPYLCTSGGELPILQFASPAKRGTGLYTRLLQDAEDVFDQATELHSSDFPNR